MMDEVFVDAVVALYQRYQFLIWILPLGSVSGVLLLGLGVVILAALGFECGSFGAKVMGGIVMLVGLFCLGFAFWVGYQLNVVLKTEVMRFAISGGFELVDKVEVEAEVGEMWNLLKGLLKK